MLYTIIFWESVMSLLISVAEVPQKNYLLHVGLLLTNSALFYRFLVLWILSLLFLCKLFLEIKKNSSLSWKSLFLVEVNYFNRDTNLSNQLMMSYVWRSFQVCEGRWWKKIWECQTLKLGDPMCTPNKYSRRLKRLSLGMRPCIPLFINNYQFVPRCTIFLSLHALCAMLGASRSFLFLVFFLLCLL